MNVEIKRRSFFCENYTHHLEKQKILVSTHTEEILHIISIHKKVIYPQISKYVTFSILLRNNKIIILIQSTTWMSAWSCNCYLHRSTYGGLQLNYFCREPCQGMHAHKLCPSLLGARINDTTWKSDKEPFSQHFDIVKSIILLVTIFAFW